MQDVATKKRWSDLTGRQRAAILVAASVELALTATALVDLIRRPAAQVRGPKALWARAASSNRWDQSPISCSVDRFRTPDLPVNRTSSSGALRSAVGRGNMALG